MPGDRKIIAQDEGVALWQTDLVHGGVVAATSYYLPSLRTPERPGFSSESAARAAFGDEVAICRTDDLVQQRLAAR